MNLGHTVEQGIAVLDAVYPTWYEDVPPEDLDMQSKDNCMLGLLFGGFEEGKAELGITIGAEFGFAIPRGLKTAHEHRQAWKELRRLWLEEIEVRLLRSEMKEAELAIA